MNDIKIIFDNKFESVHQVLNDWRNKLSNLKKNNNKYINVEYLDGIEVNLGDIISIEVDYN
jgi:DNA-binding Xre family transcriptional regulator